MIFWLMEWTECTLLFPHSLQQAKHRNKFPTKIISEEKEQKLWKLSLWKFFEVMEQKSSTTLVSAILTIFREKTRHAYMRKKKSTKERRFARDIVCERNETQKSDAGKQFYEQRQFVASMQSRLTGVAMFRIRRLKSFQSKRKETNAQNPNWFAQIIGECQRIRPSLPNWCAWMLLI